MTLASRLSTQANVGKMQTSEQVKPPEKNYGINIFVFLKVQNVVVSSISLIETQALIVTFMATGIFFLYLGLFHK
jgi:hypothetical protein